MAKATAVDTNDAAVTAVMVAISKLRESELNPRKTFTAMEELTESVKRMGIITPLLARPVNGWYELAAGARRLRAALAAGLKQVPVIVRPMDDAEFQEVQTIENLQREGLDEIEEADGYQLLASTRGYTAAEIAERVCKSESYVQKRMVLVNLIEDARQALREDRIQLGHAVRLARLAPDVQKSLFSDHLFSRDWHRGKYDLNVVPVAELDEIIRDRVLLDLGKVAWSKLDPDLVPAAGSCNSCSKRTGANAALFDDIGKGDHCLDPNCFAEKTAAHLVQIETKFAADEVPLVPVSLQWGHSDEIDGVTYKNGFTIIEPPKPAPKKKGKKAPDENAHLDEDDDEDVNDASTKTCDHVEKALVKCGPETGRLLDICRSAACPVHGNRSLSLSSSGVGTRSFEAVWADKEKRLQERIKLAVKQETFRQLVDSAPNKMGRAELEALGDRLIDLAKHDGQCAVGKALGLEPKKDGYRSDYEGPLQDWMRGLKDAQLPGFLIGVSVASDLAYHYSTSTTLFAAAKACGVDPKAVEKEVSAPMMAAFREKKKRAAEKENPKPAKPKGKEKTAPAKKKASAKKAAKKRSGAKG